MVFSMIQANYTNLQILVCPKQRGEINCFVVSIAESVVAGELRGGRRPELGLSSTPFGAVLQPHQAGLVDGSAARHAENRHRGPYTQQPCSDSHRYIQDKGYVYFYGSILVCAEPWRRINPSLSGGAGGGLPIELVVYTWSHTEGHTMMEFSKNKMNISFDLRICKYEFTFDYGTIFNY